MAQALDLAKLYLPSFSGQASIETMGALFAVDLEFEGPFYKSSTAKEYMDRLREDPPADVHYALERTYEVENSACLIYPFSQPGRRRAWYERSKLQMKDPKITLVFDTNAFT